MNAKELRWHLFERDRVPEALFGFFRPKNYGTLDVDEFNLDSAKIAIGFCEDTDSSGGDARYPALIILGKGNESDILSWLHVYASETFPLSQFARVLSSDDWSRLKKPIVSLGLENASVDKWACVALGELLALSDGETEVASLPLSRAAACFSTTMARTAAFHRSDEATTMCADRLRTLETDVRFVRRAVSVADLLPIWALVGAPLRNVSDASEVTRLVIQAAVSHGAMHRTAADSGEDLLRKHQLGFASDSVEERVKAYHSLAQAVTGLSRDNAVPKMANVVLAAGAFLVGRGTSHAFLLRKFERSLPLPTAFAWFGLMAALMGPRGWDPNWSRMAKRIERQVRASFSWMDPPSADLCWPEYSWMAKTFDKVDAFVELPRLLPRVVSIEVMPGAACQFRLAVSADVAGSEDESKARRNDDSHERELRDALEQFVGLALRTRTLLERERPSAQAPSRQPSLPLDEEKSKKKGGNVRRVKRW